MCGICGIYNLDRGHGVSEATLERMADSIQHRGPDDRGYYTDDNLGISNLRLSIIDLSPAGHQPMSDESGRYWIVYNGEIYNYVELRQQLAGTGCQYFSNSDTEVILRLFMLEGAEAVKKLNGMFAFVIWDKQERKLFGARDRLGIKPFYYFKDKDQFVFGSEIKAIFESGQVGRALDAEGMADYLTFQFCLNDKTLFQNIRKLEPGCWLELDARGNLTIQKYWNLDFQVDSDHTADYFEYQRTRLLEDAVRIQLRADVPVGAHLSG